MTKAELAFFNRMIPFIIEGKSFEEAGRAVLDRDIGLFAAAVSESATGEAIRKGLAAEVYHSIRKTSAMQRAVDDAANQARSGKRNWR